MSPRPSALPWELVRRQLVESGAWTPEGISRRARARFCDKCGAVLMAGLDHDRVAMTAYCDPAPINALGEANALMNGRRTYSLRLAGGKYTLDLRGPEEITASPAGTRKDVEVLAAHRCGAAPLPNDHLSPSLPRGAAHREDHDVRPPY